MQPQFVLKNVSLYENHNVTCIDLSTQLADDTTVFLKRSEQIPLVINKIHIFSEVSGLPLNLRKV